MAPHTESTTTREIFTEPQLISYRKGKSLKDILVRANILKHLLQRSITHKINVEILEEKYKKISVLLQQLTYEITDKIYFLQEPNKSASAVALLQNQLNHWRAKSIENKKIK